MVKEEYIKKLSELVSYLGDKPVVTQLQVYIDGYYVIKSNFKSNDTLTCYNQIYGIKVVVLKEIEGCKRNEGKLVYSDGSSKIIKVFDMKGVQYES